MHQGITLLDTPLVLHELIWYPTMSNSLSSKESS